MLQPAVYDHRRLGRVDDSWDFLKASYAYHKPVPPKLAKPQAGRLDGGCGKGNTSRNPGAGGGLGLDHERSFCRLKSFLHADQTQSEGILTGLGIKAHP